jgi:CHAT domain-containing protein
VESGGVSGANREKLRAELSVRRAQADALGVRSAARPSFVAREYESRGIRPDTAILMFVPTAQATRRFLVTRGSTIEWRGADDAAALADRPHLILVGVPLTGDSRVAELAADHDLTLALTLHDALRIAELSDDARRPSLARVAIFFDPVFTPYDARISSPPPATAAFPVKPRLSATRREANFVTWRLRSSRVDRFTSFNARRQDALSDRAMGASVLHFATHAIASDQWPNGSGLLLSSFSRDGEPLNGFLSTLDLLTHRANTDLVVLSACDTARGDAAAGENVAGLARAFLGGGARRVVASLRKVDDADTARFMDEFYRRLATGETPAAALKGSRRALAAAGQPGAPLDFVLYERAPAS